MTLFNSFVADFHEHFTKDANECIYLGVDKLRDQLPDPSLAAAQSDIAEASALVERCAAAGAEVSNFDEKLDIDLAELWLRKQVHDLSLQFNGRSTKEQMPVAGTEIGDGIFMMLIADPNDLGERLSSITGRIEQVPAYLSAILDRLERPITRWVDIERQKVEGLPSLLSTVVAQAREVNWSGLERLEQAIPKAEQAMAGYLEALAKMPTEDSFHVGTETTRQIVKLRGINYSLEELHTIARSFLGETLSGLDELHVSLLKKYALPATTTVAELHKHLSETFRLKVGQDLDRVLERYQEERAKLLEFVQKDDLFPIVPDQDMKILRTPEFMKPSIPAGAMVPPPPFRSGTKTSVVYLTLSQELLDEHTELGVPTMMLHEGIPGHHLQFAWTAQKASVVRKHFNANDHAEGWTTMLEDYVLDLGYAGDLTDEVRFVAKREICRIGARVAIDLFFMSGDKKYLDVGVDCNTGDSDPFVAAGSLLQAVTGFVNERVQAELNWYSQERCYPLSYLTGNHTVWALKRRMADENTLGLSGVDLDREFHRVYLESGNMPTSYLERVFQHNKLLRGQAPTA